MIPIISAVMARRINKEKSERLRQDEEMRQSSGEVRADVNQEAREESSRLAREA